MGKKHRYSDEELQNFIKAGYRFQRKQVSQYTYIIRRKGNISKSMGAFSPELWNRIAELEEKLVHTRLPSSSDDDVKSKYDERRRIYEASVNFVRTLDIDRGAEMYRSCIHKKDSFCNYWVWDEERLFMSYLRDMYRPGVEYRKRMGDTGGDKWVILACPHYCMHCPAFQPAQLETDLGESTSGSVD